MSVEGSFGDRDVYGTLADGAGTWDMRAPASKCCGWTDPLNTDKSSIAWENDFGTWVDEDDNPVWTTGFRSLAQSTDPSSLFTSESPAVENHSVGNSDGNDGNSAVPTVDGTGNINADFEPIGVPNGFGEAALFTTTASDYIIVRYSTDPELPPFTKEAVTPGPEWWPSEGCTRTAIRFIIVISEDTPWRSIDGSGLTIKYTKKHYQCVKTPASATAADPIGYYGPTYEIPDEPTSTETLTIDIGITPGFFGMKKTAWIQFVAADNEILDYGDVVVEPMQKCIGDS